MDVLTEQLKLVMNPSSSDQISASEASTNSTTMAQLVTLAVEKHALNNAVIEKVGDAWESLSYAQFGEIIKSIAKGLIVRGVTIGDKISILGNTRTEWTFCDLAAMCAGAAVAPIYQTNSPEECEYVLNHSEAKILFLEDAEQLAKIEEVRDQLQHLELIVMMNPGDELGEAISLEDLKAEGAGLSDADYLERVEAIQPDDICKVIYTSGTTGPPKGCLLSHANFRATTTMAETAIVGDPQEIVYLYLPLAHVFALLIQYVTFDVGGTLAYWEGDPQKIVPNIMEVKPHSFPSVPRVFEKIYTLANNAAATKPPEERELFKQAIEVGFKVRMLQAQGKEIPEELQVQFEAANEPVYQLVRSLFGGRMKRAMTGAAPIASEILEFFFACGVPVLEGYGMTETSTLATANTIDAFRFGSVGRPVPGCEMMAAKEDGELLIKGPNIFQGYYKNQSATSETIDADGWLHTGDLGHIDDDGFVFITGRKKDIIITAGGKNLTPANFENAMKQNRWVSQSVMFADRRPYPVAIVTLDPEEAPALATELGIEPDIAEMAVNPKVREVIQSVIVEVNKRFATVEQVKKFEILDHDLSQPTGELTPTLKVKRNVVYEKYAQVFASMYDEQPFGDTA